MSVEKQFSLAGKVNVVTGGTGVLGASFVKSIAEAGVSVAILGRNAEIAQQRADEINTNGDSAIGVVADVLDEVSLEKARQTIILKFGKIDGLVNAAGGNMPGTVVEPTASIFNLNMDALKQGLSKCNSLT